MGGGDASTSDVPAGFTGSPDPSDGMGSPHVAPSQGPTPQEEDSGRNSGLFGDVFSGLFGGGAAEDDAPTYPSYIAEDLKHAATEEALVARAALPLRTEEWIAEKAASKAEGRGPDLGLKFIYAWTLTKCLSSTEHRRGCSLLQALLEEDGYDYPDECALGIAQSHYYMGQLPPARHFCEVLLRMRPDSDRALKLHGAIRAAQASKAQGNAETAAVGGALLIAGLALAFAAGGKSKR